MTPYEQRAGSPRGAPFGRINGRLRYAAGKVHLRQVPLDRGGYDPGGAYWGVADPLWCAWQGDQSVYFRAADRSAARAELLNAAPGLVFYR